MAAVPDLQRPSSAAAVEGTIAHEAVETSLRTGTLTAPPDMLEDVRMLVNYVDEIRHEAPDVQLKFEEYLEFPQPIVPANDCAGIQDIVGHSASLRAGYLIDFKYGAVPVAAENNAQLVFGAISAFWDAPVDRITLAIVQPNAYVGEQIKTWDIRASDLIDEREAVLNSLHAASQPDAPLIAGDHCYLCPAEPACLVREELALREIIDAPDARHLPTSAEAYVKAVDLSPDRRAAILNAKAGIIAWLNSVSNDAMEKAMSGEPTPGWKVVEARAARKWHGEPGKIAEELITMSNYELSLDDVMPRQLVTITEIEARLRQITGDQAPQGKKKQAIEDLGRDFAFLTTKVSSGNHTLVPESDRRPAAKPAAAAFGHVQIESPDKETDNS